MNWWRDEELRVAELEAAVDLYAKVKPQIVLTHDGRTKRHGLCSQASQRTRNWLALPPETP